MDPEEVELFYESVITEFRQALADAQNALARANARIKAQDRIIAGLTGPAEPAE